MAQLTGSYWTCIGCGDGEDGYRSDRKCLRDLINHTARCRKCPPGHTVSVNGRVVWRKD